MTGNHESFIKVVAFIRDIGISICEENLDNKHCFLPGCSIRKGGIVYDWNKLLYPGDVLHEAGHIAVVPADERALLDGVDVALRKDHEAEEMMAIAWSYAACVHLDIDPHFVFHDHGYMQGGADIVNNFRSGHYFGVPVLQWLGMTTTAKHTGVPTYPAMLKWLRD